MGRFLGIIPVGGVTGSRLFRKLALKAFAQCDKVNFDNGSGHALAWQTLLLYRQSADHAPDLFPHMVYP